MTIKEIGGAFSKCRPQTNRGRLGPTRAWTIIIPAAYQPTKPVIPAALFFISTVYLTTQTWTLGFRHKINWRECIKGQWRERENKSVKIEIKVYVAHKSALETRSERREQGW